MEKKKNFQLSQVQNNCYHIHFVIQDIEYSELITLGVITFSVALNAKCNNAKCNKLRIVHHILIT